MRSLFVTSLFLGSLVTAVVAGACGGQSTGLTDSLDASVADDAGGIPATEGDAGDGINSTGSGAGSGAETGLPCDVQQLLENRCIGCHLNASPPPLLNYADLQKPSATDPAKTMAQKSVERMKSTTAPMPPTPAVAPTAAEIATFEAWVNAGAPKGTVCTPKPGTDGGTIDAGPPTNYNTPLVCTSKQTWTKGNQDSPLMRPGGACITCHTMKGGPAFTVAGTVYPTAHEPNDCNGSNVAGTTVVVTDKNGVVKSIPVSSVGNFYSSGAVAAPFHVKVVSGAKERAMAGALTAGDCNTCHTATGVNGAPGRIMAP